jgi:hypothetical protein
MIRGRLLLAGQVGSCYIFDMEQSSIGALPVDLAAELERKYFWWEPIGARPRSEARILAQAMEFASFADVRRLESVLGCERLADAMLGAQPGWISDRSWEFWRGRLRASRKAIPETPPRRSYDGG